MGEGKAAGFAVTSTKFGEGSDERVVGEQAQRIQTSSRQRARMGFMSVLGCMIVVAESPP